MTEASAQIALPQYQAHKKVWALKIKSVEDNRSDGINYLSWENSNYARRRVSDEYMVKHKPVAGGYWVRYSDGYESFSPAEAFESGYTLITGRQTWYDSVDRAPSPPPYQERVKKEADDLCEKLRALGLFMKSEQFSKLHNDEQIRLTRQHGYMDSYLEVLQDRIAAFRA